MTKIEKFCDFCGRQITSTSWDEAPCKIHLNLGGPAQAFESRIADDVCNPCRKAVVAAWDKLKTQTQKP